MFRVNCSPLSSGGLPAATNWNWSAPPEATCAAIVPWSLLSRRIVSPVVAIVPAKVTGGLPFGAAFHWNWLFSRGNALQSQSGLAADNQKRLAGNRQEPIGQSGQRPESIGQ